jgi:fibronectin type 3 domain-containing protein
LFSLVTVRSFCFHIALLAGLLAATLHPAGTAHAQPTGELGPMPHGDLRIVGTSDGHAFVFHRRLLRLSEGFHVYRTTGGSEQRITDTPVRPAPDAGAFAQTVGAELTAVLDALDADNAQQAFLLLRGSPVDAERFSLSFSGVARALGRVFVDSAAVGGPAGYRLVFIDREGEPAGEELSGSTRVVFEPPRAPTGLEAESQRGFVELEWQYAEPGPGLDDHVARFRVYERTAAGLVRHDPNGVLRIDTRAEQSYRFAVAETGQTRTFSVVAVDAAGEESAAAEVTFVVRDVVAPRAPEGVEARTAGGSAVEVTWPVSPEPDVAGYYVTRGRDVLGAFERVGPGLLGPFETVLVDSSHRAGGAYLYRVVAVDASGNESDPSGVAQAVVRDTRPPPPPGALSARYDATADAVRLSWRAAPRQDDFKTYSIMRRHDKQEAELGIVNVDTLRETSYLDRGPAGEGFAPGAFYTFGVAVEDNGRNRSDTSTVRLRIPDTTAPTAPALSADARYGRGIHLAWNAPPEADATHVLLYRAEGAGEPTLHRRIGLDSLAWTDASVAVGQSYRYRLSAVDSLGNASEPGPDVRVTLRDPHPPRAVAGVRAQATDAGVVVTWGPVPADDLARYRLYRSTSATGRYQAVGEAQADARQGLDPEGSVGRWYVVRAVDTSGNESQASRPAQATQ